MKLLYILLGLVLVALAGGSFYYTNMKTSTQKLVVATSTPTTESIYIYREYGDVSFKNKAATSYVSVGDSKMLIANYASVKTGDGRGYVIFPDNSSITLSSSTEIEISYEPTKVSIMQLLGYTYHRVTALATGNKYEVRTPNTLAAIRGTKLAVVYNPITKKTLVAVTEHSVEVTETKADGTISKAPVMVQEGSLADVQSSTSTTKASTSTKELEGIVVIRKNEDVKEIQNFISENRPIDKEYDKTPLDARKEFMEKVIDALKKDKEGAVSKTATESEPAQENTPVKKETRAETVTRVLKQTTSTAPTTPVTNTIQKVTPTEKTTSVSPSVDIKPSSSPVSERTPATAPTLGTKPFIPSENPTEAEQNFVDTFYNTYERLFLVDDAQAYCKRLAGMSAKSMFTSLTDVTTKAGYTLPRQEELLSFATDLVAACADGTMSGKVSTFKTRFDTAYPY